MASPESIIEQGVRFAYENWQLTLASIIIGAFTVKQRLAVKRRDNEECQAGDIIPHRHRGRLEVHHVTPQAYHYANGSDPDYPENAITLCQEAHQRIHPDLPEALEDYQKGDKEAFKKMGLLQQYKAARGEIFWDSRWDAKMNTRARRNTEDAKKKGWSWPLRNGDQQIEDNGE